MFLFKHVYNLSESTWRFLAFFSCLLYLLVSVTKTAPLKMMRPLCRGHTFWFADQVLGSMVVREYDCKRHLTTCRKHPQSENCYLLKISVHAQVFKIRSAFFPSATLYKTYCFIYPNQMLRTYSTPFVCHTTAIASNLNPLSWYFYHVY